MTEHRDPVATAFAEELGRIAVGPATSFNGHTLFPLSWNEEHETGVLLADETEDRTVLEILENPRGPEVQTIYVRNPSEQPVLLAEGTIIRGAMQNRVVHVSVVLEPKGKAKIPVSCVERGRWHWVSKNFLPEDIAPRTLRATIQAYRTDTTKHGLQSKVWHLVSRSLKIASVHSPTEDLASLMETVRHRYGEQRKALGEWFDQQLRARSVGLMAFCNGSFAGLEVFGEPEHWKKRVPRLIDALLADWMIFAEFRPGPSGAEPDPKSVLTAVAQGARQRVEPIARSEEIDIQGDTLSGNAVLYKGKVSHLSVFASLT